ncbi:MAG: sigma-54-dependent Fis family transcriptional regulator [Blastocatellia bacterium]|nr:sigma-54-dependent Fis family transcriptional regulator [Blastocatellia bacterium]
MNELVLIAEDDDEMRDLLQEELETTGYRTLLASDGRTALAYIRQVRDPVDLVITDVQMPGLKGGELLAEVRKCRAETPVIVITGFGSVRQAVEMTQSGAFQYLTKPFETKDLLRLAAQALERSAPQREQARLRRELPSAPPRIIGASRPMRELFDLMARTSQNSRTILITGESGTGKELVARAIHEQSGRSGAFIAVNCAAIPADLMEAELFGHTGQAFTGAKQARPGLFESADNGTLFLDEIGELPLPIQPKLLRVLQEGFIRRLGADHEHQVNVRVVAATHRNLELEMREGRFREDLYWRLNVITLRVPALRERSFDIPLLVEYFINRATRAISKPPLDISPEALALLTAYTWPGNVRELENAVEHAVAFAQGAELLPEDLPERVRGNGATAAIIAHAKIEQMSLRELERMYILETLRKTGGNKLRAAEILGLDRKTLYRRLAEYRIENQSEDQDLEEA